MRAPRAAGIHATCAVESKKTISKYFERFRCYTAFSCYTDSIYFL